MPISTLCSKRDMGQHGGRRKKQAWTSDEKKQLLDCINSNGARNWKAIAKYLGTGRNAASCRDQYNRSLKSNIKKGEFTDEEILFILEQHRKLGNRWSTIAKKLPGRIDNDIKNFWNTSMKNEAKELGCDLNSEEFLYKMKEILRERIQAAAGGSGVTADTPVNSLCLDDILGGLPYMDCSDESFWATPESGSLCAVVESPAAPLFGDPYAAAPPSILSGGSSTFGEHDVPDVDVSEAVYNPPYLNNDFGGYVNPNPHLLQTSSPAYVLGGGMISTLQKHDGDVSGAANQPYSSNDFVGYGNTYAPLLQAPFSHTSVLGGSSSPFGEYVVPTTVIQLQPYCSNQFGVYGDPNPHLQQAQFSPQSVLDGGSREYFIQ